MNPRARAVDVPASESRPRCFHCGLPATAPTRAIAQIAGEEREFCCSGCQAVCSAIYAAGLEDFYRRAPSGERLGPPPAPPRRLALYDLDEVQCEFTDIGANQREIHLAVEGIHCAACVWLIENAVQSMPGVSAARVNLTGRRLRLCWDHARLPLSRVLDRLGELGYAAQPFDPEAAEGSLKRHNRALLYRMAFAGFAAMNLMWISIALYAGADQGEFRGLFHWIGLLIATPTLLYAGYPFLRGAWNGLRAGHLTMDLPIAIGASITYAYSFDVTLGGAGHVYWDTLVNFLFVILIGRYLEAISRHRAVAATQRLLDLQPKVATLLRDGQEMLVPIRAVHPGDLVLIRPGEAIPVDAEVVEGESSVDEALLTGESIPVTRGPGQRVVAGSLNGAGVLRARVTAVLQQTVLGRITRLVEDAQASKAPIQTLADRIVPWFVAATLTLAFLTFFLWMKHDIETALMAATAVLIITCPCAFGLATPMAIAVASGLGARHGILIKNGAVLEMLSCVDYIVFDKTGTLTEGRPEVSALADATATWRAPAELRLGPPSREYLNAIVALETRSEHPLARALVRFARASGLDGQPTVADARVRPGRGMRAAVDGRIWVVGNAAWLVEQGATLDPDLPLARDASHASLLRCAVDGREVMQILLSDRLRADAPEVIAALRAQGMGLSLVTGDRWASAESMARPLGAVDIRAEVLPEEKDRIVAELRRAGHRVAMIGDGLNDAPALARADVGIAIGTGTDLSIASADLVLMRADFGQLTDALALARRALRAIRQNIGLSIGYNLMMIPLAAAALITPLVAAIAMPLSSLAVIGNSARIGDIFRADTRLVQGRRPRG